MVLSFSCECGQQLQAKEEYAGRRTRCPKCGRDVMIPSIETAPAPEPPPRPEAVVRRPRPDVSHHDDEDDDDRDEPRRRRRRQPEGTSTAAVFSLVLGILSLCLLFLAGIPAIILGVVGLRAVSRSGGRLGGRGLAVGGIILGTVGTLCTCLAGLAVPGTAAVRNEAAKQQSRNNLKQISLALINYGETYQRLPPAVVYDREGRPLYSWRVLILPFIEEDQLYREFHLDEPWDSPNNKPLLARMPKTYAPPGTTIAEPYATYYQVFDGPGAAFNSDKTRGLQPFNAVPPGPNGPVTMTSNTVVRFPVDFLDGTSNTFLVAEAAEAVPWSKPADLLFDPNAPPPKLGGLFGGDFNVGLADGSVRLVPKKTDAQTIRACITIAGGEPLFPP
jgi:hypothetical protein